MVYYNLGKEEGEHNMSGWKADLKRKRIVKELKVNAL